MIEIKSRHTGAVIYRSETATTLADAVIEAVRSGADLTGAHLRGADLTGANLSGANLSGAGVSELRGVIAVAVTWPGHGQCGRQLLAVRDNNGTVYHCGCFRGSRDELISYIANDDSHKPSRTLTLDVVDMLLAASEVHK
jgi:hypothetical protein